MNRARAVAGLALAALATPAVAGPPYLTDDPVPTDAGHWEIYAFTSGEGRQSIWDGDAGVDLNYGPAKNVQLTASLPLSFAHDARGWRTGTADIELGVKYRFLNHEDSGLSAAIFPRAILPTSSLVDGERERILLPVWMQKNIGKTSIFGGGGYEINPGRENRDFWQVGVAVIREIATSLSIGAELQYQTPDSVGATAQTRAGIGTVIKVGGPYALLISVGPTWTDHRTGYHAYAALGVSF